MTIEQQTKDLLVLRVEFTRSYLFGFGFLLFGLVFLVTYGLTDNIALTNLHLSYLIVGFFFLLIAGSKEIVVDKKRGKIIVNYR